MRVYHVKYEYNSTIVYGTIVWIGVTIHVRTTFRNWISLVNNWSHTIKQSHVVFLLIHCDRILIEWLSLTTCPNEKYLFLLQIKKRWFIRPELYYLIILIGCVSLNKSLPTTDFYHVIWSYFSPAVNIKSPFGVQFI